MPPPPAEDRLFRALVAAGLAALLALAAWLALVGPPMDLGPVATTERLFAVLRAPPPAGLPPAPPPPAARRPAGRWGPVAPPAPPAGPPLRADELLALLRGPAAAGSAAELARALEISPELRAAFEAAEVYEGDGLPTGARAAAGGGAHADATAGPLQALGGEEVALRGPRPGDARPSRAAVLPPALRPAPPRLPPAAHAAVARAARGGVARCLAGAPGVARLELLLEIAEGRLRSARLQAPDPAPPGLDACLRARLRTWVFPEGFSGEDRFVFIASE